MLNKDIWIINQYAGSPQTQNPARHYYIAKILKKIGFNVTIILATYTHGRDRGELEDEFYQEEVEGIHYIWIKTPKYKNPHGLGRIRNWFLFAFQLRKLVNLNLKKPNVIYYSSLSLIGYLGAEFLKKYYKTLLVFEVRDIWPLTLQDLKGLSKGHPFIYFLRKIELRAYKNSDFIISNLSNFRQYLEENNLKDKKFLWIPNGFDRTEKRLNLIYENLPKKDNNIFRVGYAGSLGIANNMLTFIEVANKMKDQPSIEFYILGDGPQKDELQEKCQNPNVYFLAKTSKGYIQSFLQQVDCCYIGWNESRLYEYGIGANKFLDYMLSGKPIINSYSGKGDPVKIFDIGITVDSNDHKAIKKAILDIKSYNENRLEEVRINALKALNEYYDYNITVKYFYEDFLKKFFKS